MLAFLNSYGKAIAFQSSQDSRGDKVKHVSSSPAKLMPPRLVIAVLSRCPQVAGGNSIFNVIVDTDDTAARLMTLLERRKLGRVTFMPLNKLSGRNQPRKEIKKEVVYLIEVCSTCLSRPCLTHVPVTGLVPFLSPLKIGSYFWQAISLSSWRLGHEYEPAFPFDASGAPDIAAFSTGCPRCYVVRVAEGGAKRFVKSLSCVLRYHGKQPRILSIYTYEARDENT